MKTNFLFLLFIILFSFPALAQSQYVVKGVVADTSSGVKLVNTAISVLNAKDSTLVRHTRAASNGSFTINNLAKGKFILLVTYHGYADYVEQFSLDSVNSVHDFGEINMILKARLLQEVIISGSNAIKIKGDTTEFNASSYKIQPNDRVEDLLKQFPGIQVDKDGKITAQGVTVSKVLVEGEEFFGDDPTLVTRNIRADMVDKVQLYDKKSDQATFTGIDDGQRTKTLNVVLKADSKNGFFGKADAGKALDDYYQGQTMFNAFKTKQKFSVYGTVGNTNRTGLSFQESSKIGTSQLEATPDGTGVYIGGGGDELESFNGNYSGRGLPDTKTGGIHYDAKWNSDKESINLNYKIGSMDVNGVQTTLEQNNLPTETINSNRGQTNNNSLFRQKLDATYQLAITPTWNLKVTADGTLRSSQSNSEFKAAMSRADSSTLNDQTRTISNDLDQKAFNMSAFLTKKFKKVGRTASLLVSQAFNDSQTEGFAYSTNNFYNATGNLVDSTRIVDQYKPTTSNSYSFNSNLTYSEPITQTFSIVMNYGLNVSNSTSDNRSYDPSAPGQYNILNTTFSNNFQVNAITNNAGAVFNYVKKKTTINFGTRLSAVRFDQEDLINGKKYDRDYLNWTPQASYMYRFSQQKSLRIGYNGSTRQPTLNQLQPIRVNTDPLNITLGNPDLRPSYSSSINVSYNSYKFTTSQSLYLYGSYSFTNNAIVSNISQDAAGKNTFDYVNMTTKAPSNYYGYISTSRKFKNDLSINFGIDISGATSYNYSNNALNKSDDQSYGIRIGFNKAVVKKYDFYISLGPNYRISKSSVQTTINNNGAGFNANGRLNIFLPKKFQITIDGSYLHTAKTQTFNEDFDRILINTTLTKKFLKKDNLSLLLSGNDLLNQNAGFTTSQSNNLITRTNYTTIKRYTLLSLVWDFTKMGGASTPQ